VKREPAPPSTRPCDALMSEASHAGAPAAWVGEASGGLGTTDGGDALGTSDGDAPAGEGVGAGAEADGDGVEVHAASSSTTAATGAASDMAAREVRPRRACVEAARVSGARSVVCICLADAARSFTVMRVGS
jgi:hypothetical protein